MKRLLVLLTWSLIVGAFSLSFVAAQETVEPTPSSSLDEVPVGATPEPLPTRMGPSAPSFRVPGDRAELALYFNGLPQGETRLMGVTGAEVTAVRARFLNELIDFFPVEGQGYFGLLTASMEQTPRTYPLDIFVSYTDGTRGVINTEVELVLGAFIRQDVVLAPDKAHLLNGDIERAELARLESIFSEVTLERYWDSDGFQMPILSTLTSPFGAFRSFNSTLNTRHTGWDVRTTLGTPVMASAAGRVAFAGLFDIRGNYVIIDHGYGVFSGYAHLSQVHVTRGQDVAREQIIGMTGENGRTSGPHFHWEMAVNGEWVDSVQFLEMWMP